jgi:hypothetical protein
MEVAKYQINSILWKENNQYKAEVSKLQSEIASLKQSHFRESPILSFTELDNPYNISGLGAFMLAVAFFFIVKVLLIFRRLSETAAFLASLFTKLCYVAVTCLILCAVIRIVVHIKEKHEVRAFNAKEQQRLLSEVPALVNSKNALIQSKTTAWKQRHSYLMGEYNRVGTLLEKSYGLNIVPSQYRNLQSIYYIYDNMSTSQMSFDDTLFHEHMENGIQRILSKLDTIIAQNEEIIFETRRIEATTREISENTLKILETAQKTLESQERTEQNALEAAQNAQVAANYTEVNAFFSAASYLDSIRKS